MNIQTFNKMFQMFSDKQLYYKPYCAYEDYEGLYDEMAYHITSLGIIDNNIVLSRDQSELINNNGNIYPLVEAISGYDSMSELYFQLNYLPSIHQLNSDLEIKFRAYDGQICDIKDIIIDNELRRIVFVIDFKICNE